MPKDNRLYKTTRSNTVSTRIEAAKSDAPNAQTSEASATPSPVRALGAAQMTLPETPDLRTLVQDGVRQRRASKGEQKFLELPLEVVLDFANARYNTKAVVRAAFLAGWTNKSIARGLEISLRVVTQWTQTRTDADPLFDYPPPLMTVPKMVKRYTLIPDDRITELKALHEVVKTINGGTATDDPRRSCIKPYGDLLVQTMEEYEVGALALSKALGFSRVAVKLWLGRHGYIHLPPSQKPYMNMSAADSARINRAASR
jgi:hypothetical protein